MLPTTQGWGWLTVKRSLHVFSSLLSTGWVRVSKSKWWELNSFVCSMPPTFILIYWYEWRLTTRVFIHFLFQTPSEDLGRNLLWSGEPRRSYFPAVNLSPPGVPCVGSPCSPVCARFCVHTCVFAQTWVFCACVRMSSIFILRARVCVCVSH